MPNSLIIILSLFASCSYGAQVNQAQNTILSVGESIKVPYSPEAWIEKAAVIKLVENQSTLSIVAVKPGISTARIGLKNYSVQVLSVEQTNTMDIFKSELQSSLNLSFLISDGKVFLRGRIVRLWDWLKIVERCQLKACEYHNQTSMRPEAWSLVKARISEKLSQLSLPQLKISQSPHLNIRLSPSHLALYDELKKVLAPYGVQINKSDLALATAPMIRVNITLAEVKKGFALNYGISWPDSLSAQILPSFQPSEEAKNLRLNFLEQSGQIRVLARPNLLCRSGKEADFLAGGEFPIKIFNEKLHDVIWRKYGIYLKIKPTADDSGKMSIGIEAEVSDIDPSHTVDGIPGMLTNRLQTHFDLSKSQTLILSGLIKNETNSSRGGLPGFSQIPILGSLFSSKSFRENQSELIIIVNPEIFEESNSELSAQKEI